MKKTILAIACLLMATAAALYAQDASNSVRIDKQRPGGGQVVTPASSIQRPEDLGVRMHTHFKIFVPPGRPEGLVGFPAEKNHSVYTPVSGWWAETPATLACIYGLTTWTAGCNPSTLSKVATGGSKAIAIVDAYDYPTAAQDLGAYSAQFGLPAITASNFTRTWVSTQPGPDPYCAGENGWNCWSAESSLDIEMAHAMAPSAHIYLVEATDNSNTALFAAASKAVTLVQAAGGGEVSFSWGGGEGSGETTYDAQLIQNNVVFFVSTGDMYGTQYPSVSPNVIAVGGTTLMRSPANLNLEAEVAWEDGGCGYSPYEARPAYQSVISSIVGTHRGVPDVSAVANPWTGVWVYNSYETLYNGNPAPWNIFGGTSVAAPLTAALFNNAGHFSANSTVSHNLIYSGYGAGFVSPNFRDITYGICGYYKGWSAIPGWDPCTGLGAPYGKNGK
ncbi:MAG: S53 family peptidase [Terracidiphilus sp.]